MIDCYQEIPLYYTDENIVRYHYNMVIFLLNHHNTPLNLAHEGEIWDDFCEYKFWFIFSLSYCSAVCSIMSYWTAL